MTLHLFNRHSSVASRLEARRRRPELEGLESRTVLSAAAMAAPMHVAAQVAVHPQVAAHHQVSVAVPLSLSGINLTSITRDATGAVTALGTVTGHLLGQAFSTPITATLTPGATATDVPILHLALDPIHLNVLGVTVDTSAICLNVTAHTGPGAGNLLGNLLGGLSGVLNSAGGLGVGAVTTAANDVTGTFSQLTTILNKPSVLSGLNNVLARETSHAGSPTVTGAGTTTQILNLSIAPVDLDVLGLEVKLDNCDNGPVTVAVGAVSGPGNLLGNLLSSVAHLLDSPGNPANAITMKIQQILGRIERLV